MMSHNIADWHSIFSRFIAVSTKGALYNGEKGDRGTKSGRVGVPGQFLSQHDRRGVVINFVARQRTNTATTITTCKYSYLWSVIDANNVTSQGRGWREVM